EVVGEQPEEGVSITCCRGSPERLLMSDYLGVGRAFARGEASVELAVGGVELPDVEDDERDAAAGRIVLDDREMLVDHLPTLPGFAGEPRAEEGESLTAGRDRLAVPLARRRGEQQAEVGEEILPDQIEPGERAAVLQPGCRRERRDHAVPVALAPASP